jgi:hypothetical protein
MVHWKKAIQLVYFNTLMNLQLNNFRNCELSNLLKTTCPVSEAGLTKLRKTKSMDFFDETKAWFNNSDLYNLNKEKLAISQSIIEDCVTGFFHTNVWASSEILGSGEPIPKEDFQYYVSSVIQDLAEIIGKTTDNKLYVKPEANFKEYYKPSIFNAVTHFLERYVNVNSHFDGRNLVLDFFNSRNGNSLQMRVNSSNGSNYLTKPNPSGEGISFQTHGAEISITPMTGRFFNSLRSGGFHLKISATKIAKPTKIDFTIDYDFKEIQSFSLERIPTELPTGTQYFEKMDSRNPFIATDGLWRTISIIRKRDGSRVGVSFYPCEVKEDSENWKKLVKGINTNEGTTQFTLLFESEIEAWLTIELFDPEIPDFYPTVYLINKTYVFGALVPAMLTSRQNKSSMAPYYWLEVNGQITREVHKAILKQIPPIQRMKIIGDFDPMILKSLRALFLARDYFYVDAYVPAERIEYYKQTLGLFESLIVNIIPVNFNNKNDLFSKLKYKDRATRILLIENDDLASLLFSFYLCSTIQHFPYFFDNIDEIPDLSKFEAIGAVSSNEKTIQTLRERIPKVTFSTSNPIEALPEITKNYRESSGFVDEEVVLITIVYSEDIYSAFAALTYCALFGGIPFVVSISPEAAVNVSAICGLSAFHLLNKNYEDYLSAQADLVWQLCKQSGQCEKLPEYLENANYVTIISPFGEVRWDLGYHMRDEKKVLWRLFAPVSVMTESEPHILSNKVISTIVNQYSSARQHFRSILIAHEGRNPKSIPIDIHYALKYAQKTNEKKGQFFIIPPRMDMGIPALNYLSKQELIDFAIIIGHGNMYGNIMMGEPEADINPINVENSSWTNQNPYFVLINACEAGNIFRIYHNLWGLPLAFKDSPGIIAACWPLLSIGSPSNPEEEDLSMDELLQSPTCFFVDRFLRYFVEENQFLGSSFKKSCDDLRAFNSTGRIQADAYIFYGLPRARSFCVRD